MRLSLSKASSAIKIDIVNPIPPNILTPAICFKFNSGDKLQIPIAAAAAVKSVIPKGLPITNPAITPKLCGIVHTLLICDVSIVKAVLANAKIGKIKKATGLCSMCCKI